MRKQKLYALLSARGTACSETVLTEKEFNDPVLRAATEARAAADMGHAPPVLGTWTDVTENEACQPDVEDE